MATRGTAAASRHRARAAAYRAELRQRFCFVSIVWMVRDKRFRFVRLGYSCAQVSTSLSQLYVLFVRYETQHIPTKVLRAVDGAGERQERATAL